MEQPEFLLKQVTYYLQQQGILAAWLYGSYAKGTAGEHSDLDLALLLPESANPWQQLPELDYNLSKMANITINTISIAHAPTLLAYEAVNGQRLFGDSEAMLMEQRIWSKWDNFNYEVKQG